MKYIIFWTLVYMVPDVCPDYGRKDELGRVINPGIMCAVAHMKQEKQSLSKVIYDRDSANSFYKMVVEESKVKDFFGNNGVQSVRIDSLKIQP